MLEIGEYEARIQQKGFNEAFIEDMKEGDVYYVVQVDEYSKIDVATHVEALILSRLIMLEQRIKKIEQRQIEQLKDKLGVDK